jgi:hypothetical protein
MKTLLAFRLRPIELSDEPSSMDDSIIDDEEEISELADPFEIIAAQEAQLGHPIYFS